jgi:hypothetical protein
MEKSKLEIVHTVTPSDAQDLESLWLDPKLGDGLADVHLHNIPIGKPKDFFRVCPDPAYRRLTEIYTHKIEGRLTSRISSSTSLCRARSRKRVAARLSR